jgi:hypothetical protein
MNTVDVEVNKLEEFSSSVRDVLTPRSLMLNVMYL